MKDKERMYGLRKLTLDPNSNAEIDIYFSFRIVQIVSSRHLI